MSADTREWVRAARKRLGLTQWELARAICVSDGLIAAYECDPATSRHRTLSPRSRQQIEALLRDADGADGVIK